MSPISRRDFLKISALATGSLAFNPFTPYLSEFNDASLARVTIRSVSVHTQPSDDSRIVGQWFRDDLVNIYDEVIGSGPAYNPVWYRVWGGYIHRARMQKVKILLNKPVEDIPEKGILGEVTVPYSQSLRFANGSGWKPLYRLYQESVHWVVGLDEGPDGQPWYRLMDELLDITYHVPASHLRLVPPEEVTPISPQVPFEQKRIEVSLSMQTLTAFEYNQPVFTTKISSGIPSNRVGSNGIPTTTPSGRFNVTVKMPSKHMGDGNLAADIEAYELPGVPWTTFFTTQGHAFHGTYWHDNFGVPMSRGCVNMRTEEAKWLFRWTLPAASYDDIHPRSFDRRGNGTIIKIF